MTLSTRTRWNRGPCVRRAAITTAALLAVAAAMGCSSGGDGSTPSTAVPTTLRITTTDVGSTLVALPSADVDDDAEGIGPPRPGELDSSLELPRVCLMLSFDEIADLLGAVAVASHESMYRDLTTCYVEDDAEQRIMTMSAQGAAAFDEAASTTGARPVDGLGEGAVWTDGVLVVRVADEALSFELGPAAPPAEDAAVEQLAASTVTRYTPPPES